MIRAATAQDAAVLCAIYNEKFSMTQVAHYHGVGYKFGQWIDVGSWQLELGPST